MSCSSEPTTTICSVLSMSAPAASQAPAKRTRVAVMTSGGDAAGMNAAVRAAVKFALYKGCETFVIREGLSGLVQGNAHAESAGLADHPESESEPTPEPVPETADKALAPQKRAAPEAESESEPASASGTGQYPFLWKKPYRHQRFVPTYGDGELLREGVGGAADTGLRDRYIIRVGWDDVRGWMEQVRCRNPTFPFPLVPLADRDPELQRSNGATACLFGLLSALPFWDSIPNHRIG